MTVKNDTKERILDTAYSLFQRYGYHAVGLNEIIAKSGSPKGSLYYYFPEGKEELALCAIKRARTQIEGDIQKSMAVPGDVKTVFTEHIRDLARRVGEDGAHFSITLLALETMHVSEDLRKECTASYDMFIRFYEERLRTCGYETQRAHDLAIVIQCIVDGAITLSLLNDDMGYLEAAASQVDELL